jgi:hypothetical protein
MANPIDIPQNFSTTLNVPAGINNSQTTGIIPTTVTGLPTDGGMLAFDWASPIDTTTIEYIEYTGISAGELTGVVRGQEGYSAKTHSNGCTIVGVVSRAHIKRLRDKLTGNDATAIQDPNGNEILKTSYVASAVNEITTLNAATGNGPEVQATGGDTNIDLNLTPKGSGSVKTGGRSLSPFNSLYRNAIINGGCVIAQRVTAPNISSSYQYGSVDRFAAKATGTAVSAGTISQTTSANVGASGFALKLAGVTLTGTGVVYARYRMESKDAKFFKNLAASFNAKVYHDVGSAINYTIYIRKANAADDFSATTDIANSGAISVNSTTVTTISFTNINSGNIGDVSNGIEIEIQAACGAITTKNFEFGDFVFNLGASALSFETEPFEVSLEKCQRYYSKSFEYATAPAQNTATNNGAEFSYNYNRTTLGIFARFPVRMRIAPTTFTTYNPSAANNQWYDSSNGASRGISTESLSDRGVMLFTTSASATGDYKHYIHWSADAEL